MTDQISPAVQAARQAQARLEHCLEVGRNFRLEAGAGAGKTYSLVAALRKLIDERGAGLMHAGQQVACITFTEVAKEEIASEIEAHPAILVNTIHGFSWAFISRFQKTLRSLVAAQESRREAIEAAGGIRDQRVDYGLGFFGIDEKRITLHHDDVPKFFSEMLANPKFKHLFKSLYPIVFVDEYQDTEALVMTALSQQFFATGEGPLVGLFGDHWQTIYRKDYRLLELPNVEGIDKGSNFRSVPAIVDMLNRLRPELPQQVDDPAAAGEARFFHCNRFAGERASSSHAKAELPPAVLTRAVERIKARLRDDGWDFDPSRTKILMLTHNAIAAERGYPTLAKIFEHNEAFSKKEDATIAFLADIVEPICAAYASGDFGAMFRLMGGTPTIQRSADKVGWRTDMDTLMTLRDRATIGQVIDHLMRTRRPRLSDRVNEREEEIRRRGHEVAEDEPKSVQRHRQLREVTYSELIALADFVNGFTPLATQHSVKGAEFENVLVLLSGGWNHYNWPKFLDAFHTQRMTAADQAGYFRARNLFYVSVSRPRKRLAVLATQTLSDSALAAAEQLFTAANLVALPMDE